MNNDTKNAIKLLLVLLGIGSVAATFFLFFKPTKEEVDSLKATNSTLQARLDDLKAKEAKKAQLEEETKQYEQSFQDELANYPAVLNQATTVMFMKGTEQQTGVLNKSFTMPEATTYYTLGQGVANPDTTITTADSETLNSNDYIVTTCPYNVAYEGTYVDLKKYLNYISEYKYRMNISQINITFDQDEMKCSGAVTLNGYAISGPDRTPETVDLNVKEGKDNLFTQSAGSTNAAASKYDTDKGASIVSNHNLMIYLNNAQNDSSSGIIVASDENDESTYVTSTNNSVEDLTITINEVSGKKTITYQIGDKSYSAPISTSDVTIYVKSSSRVDTSDKNGVNVSVRNATGVGVYIKVADDDATSPRFKLASKIGTVKVY